MSSDLDTRIDNWREEHARNVFSDILIVKHSATISSVAMSGSQWHIVIIVIILVSVTVIHPPGI